MNEMRVGGLGAVLYMAMGAGCATTSMLGPVPAGESKKVVQYAADVLLDAVSYTLASGREVGGLCWSDKATGKLTSVAQADIGGQADVGLAVPLDTGGTRYVSCTWHTHTWAWNVVPGPSKNDLRSSTYPLVSGIAHFVLDRNGIWQYSQGRVIEMCPWNSAGNDFDLTRCRSGFDGPTNIDSPTVHVYGP